MTVQELIEFLKACRPDMHVVISSPVQGDYENVEAATYQTFYVDYRYNNVVIFP